MWSIIRIITFFLIISIARAAWAEGSRHVEGGDIIYTQEITRKTEALALSAADRAAAQLVAVECSIIPRDTYLSRRTASDLGGAYSATVEIVVSFDDCYHARRAKDKTGLENAKLSQILDSEEKPEPVLNDNVNDKRIDSSKRILTEIRGLRDSLNRDRIERRMVDLAQREPQREVAGRTPGSNREVCQAQYRAALAQAQAVANNSYPPGNLASGAAAPLYNQALAIQQACR